MSWTGGVVDYANRSKRSLRALLERRRRNSDRDFDKERRKLKKRSPQSEPAPIAIASNQLYMGNDGPWSTFTLQIGNPPQAFQVLPSTSGYQSWVVLPQGCTPDDPPNCAISRGGEFIAADSKSWKLNNVTSNGTFTLGLDANLGYQGNGQYGYDTVTLGVKGSGGPSLDQQIVAGIATKNWYLGMFGLNPRPTNFTNFNDPVPSYLSNLRNKSMIPSLSYSYTAGNVYNQAQGDLVLGGYDASQFVSNKISFNMSDVDLKDLTVNVENIAFTNGENSTMLSNSTFQAFIDSSIPYLYLPLDVCRKFENAFGISYNDDYGAYLVSDAQHSAMTKQNASVSLKLRNGNATAGSVEIDLPYSAFDLTASYPLVLNSRNSSRYFPLMRAENETQYTLGRTFLQEAYLTADYERRNFSISKCNSTVPRQQNLIAIRSPSSGDSSVNETASGNASPSLHLTIGQILAVTISVILAFLLTAIFVLILERKRKRTLARAAEAKRLSEETKAVSDETETSPSSAPTGPISELFSPVSPFEVYEIGSNGQRHRSELYSVSTSFRDEMNRWIGGKQELEGAGCSHEMEDRQIRRHELPAREVAARELEVYGGDEEEARRVIMSLGL